MVELSAEQIAQRAFDLDLLDERQLQDIRSQISGREVSGDEFRQLLLRRELLTNYQAERLLRNERSGFFYGDYKVLYLVGTGTFARVYRAVHKRSGQVVAVKVLRRRFSDDPAEAERFRREGEMGATLRHPNIVPIFEVVSRPEANYLVMDFIEGRNLREFIKIRKKFDPASATRLMIDIAAGLQYAFQRGICHRDLKMSNVLVSSRGQAKLLDFGLAAADKNLSDEAIADSPNPRTIDYAGLERATGVRKDDPRTDIYFLGCIYYNLLSGHPPLYETKDRIQRLSKTRFQEVKPLGKVAEDLPRPILAVVHKAMELDPNLRYQSPGEMLNELRSAGERMHEVDADPDTGPDAETPSRSRLVSGSAAPQRTLMFIDSNVELQDIFRERLKTGGYRVLVTRDPVRALERFAEEEKVADGVIFSTEGLGEAAFEAFNRFATDKATAGIPAILLLAEPHRDWKSKARVGPHHVAVPMPIRLKELREILARLVPPGASS